MSERKLVSWRIENIEPEQRDPVNKWLDAQPNIQVALTNLVMHMIAHFGHTNIMNYDVQRALYTGFNEAPVQTLNGHEIKVVRNELEATDEKPVETTPVTPVVKEPVVEKKVVETPTKTEDDSDGLYKDLNL